MSVTDDFYPEVPIVLQGEPRVYGRKPVPLLPKVLRDAWRGDAAPPELRRELGDQTRLEHLGPEVWESVDSVSREAIQSLVDLVASRQSGVGGRRTFPKSWTVDVARLRRRLPARAENCLERAGLLEDPQRLVSATFSELLRVQGMGTKSVLEIACTVESLQAAEDIDDYVDGPNEGPVTAAPPEGPVPSPDAVFGRLDAEERERQRRIEEVGKVALGKLRLIAAWAAGEMHVDKLEEVLHLPENRWPQQTAEAWQSILDADVRSLAGDKLYAFDVRLLAQELLSGLSERDLFVITNRTCSLEPATLSDLGDKLGVTREGVRQAEQKTVRKLRNRAETAPLQPLMRRAARLAEDLGVMAPMKHEQVETVLAEVDDQLGDPICRSGPAGRALLLWLAGPYELDGAGWLVDQNPSQLALDLNEIEGSMRELADPGGRVPSLDVRAALEDAGIRPAFQQDWIEQQTDFRFRPEHDDYIDESGHLIDLAVRALHRIGSPAPADQVVKEIGKSYSVRSAKDRFNTSPEIIRVGKDDFGLAEWGFDEYTGVSDEIAQEIEACGGVASLEHLQAVIPDRYGVSPSSVRAYAGSPRFIMNEAGHVRIRTEDDPGLTSGESLETSAGCYRFERGWAVRVDVDSDLLRGSGRRCPAAFAEHLGVHAGENDTFECEGVEVYVGWPSTSPHGPSIGSLRQVAERLSCDEGDWLFVGEREGGLRAWTRERQAFQQATAREKALLLIGEDPDRVGDWRKRLAVAVGLPDDVSLEAIRRRLRERGDHDIVALLPAEDEEPGSIGEALSGLRSLFED